MPRQRRRAGMASQDDRALRLRRSSNDSRESWWNARLRKQAKYSDAGLGAHVDFSIRDHRGNKFVAIAKVVAAAGGLIGVIEFDGKIIGVIGVQNSRRVVLRCPQDQISFRAA